MHQHYSDGQAEALDMVIPNEDSESEDSSSQSDEVIAAEHTPARGFGNSEAHRE